MSDPIEEVVTEETPETRHPQPKNPPKMATITSKLKKYFGGSKKPQTVATEIPAEGGNSGGGGGMVVEMTKMENDKGYASSNATAGEILNAITSGKSVVLHFNYSNSLYGKPYITIIGTYDTETYPHADESGEYETYPIVYTAYIQDSGVIDYYNSMGIGDLDAPLEWPISVD